MRRFLCVLLAALTLSVPAMGEKGAPIHDFLVSDLMKGC